MININKLILIVLWALLWFSSYKISLGLKMPLEFFVLYTLFVWQIFNRKITLYQYAALMGLSLISLLDYLRTANINSFMFLGFVIPVFSLYVLIFKLSAFNEIYKRKNQVFFLIMFPVVAISLRVLFPELGKIDTHDTYIIGGVEVQRLNLLGYESNSLAIMMVLLTSFVLTDEIYFSNKVKTFLVLTFLLVILFTLSRIGVVAFVIVLLSFFYLIKRLVYISLYVGLLSIALIMFGYHENNIALDVSNRFLDVNYFENDRSVILISKLSDFYDNLHVLFFGRGFMNVGAYDNTFLALVHGYGIVGSFAVVIFLLVLFIGRTINSKFFKNNILLLIPFVLYMLTVDVYGQVKVVICLMVLLAFKSLYKPYKPHSIVENIYTRHHWRQVRLMKLSKN